MNRESDNRTLTLSVNNPGEAIPESVLPRLFEPFFTTKSSGTGLGLGIVKRMVDGHGGDISIRSSDSQGTTVTLHIPLA